MKSKLQKKDIFVPLSGGADTGTDPRTPRSPTLTVEDGHFNAEGRTVRRDALATFVGNLATDTPAQNSSTIYLAEDVDGGIVTFGGPKMYERSSAGSLIGGPTSSQGSGIVVDVDRDTYHASNSGAYYCAKSVQATSDGDEDVIVHCGSEPISTVYFHGVDSGKLLALDDTDLSGPCTGIINHSSENGAWAFYSAEDEVGATFANADALTISDSTNLVDDCSIFQHGDIGGEDRAISYRLDGSNVVVNHLVLSGLDVNATSNVGTTISASGGRVDSIYLRNANNVTNDETNHVACAAYSNSTHLYLSVTMDGLSDGSVDHIADGETSLSSYTNISITSVRMLFGAASSGICLVCFSCDDSRDRTVLFGYTVSGSTVSFVAPKTVGYNMSPVSRVLNNTGDMYMVFEVDTADDRSATETSVDEASGQHTLMLFKYYSDEEYAQFYPIAEIDRSTNDQSHDHQVEWSDSNTIMLTTSDGLSAESSRYVIDFSEQQIKSTKIGDVTVIPGALPKMYGGDEVYPSGALSYPESVTVSVDEDNVTGNFTNAGGAGAYYYAATYVIKSSRGLSIESAPSPAVGATVVNTDGNAVATVTVPFPSALSIMLSDASYATCELYRTSADGNDFFRVASSQLENGSGYVTFTDDGTDGFTANTGLDILLTAKALYTQNGSLENILAYPHRAGTEHSGRYIYAPRYKERTQLLYSKSVISGIFPEFNEVLEVSVPSQGGRTRALVSSDEKLYIFKERSILITYGDPLNDTGAGQGFAPPRVVTDSGGCLYPAGAASGDIGVVFINSIDGLVYVISGDRPQLIGDPVRYYCEQYGYNNVWFAPQDNCVRVSSPDAGAPTLSFNYQYNKWSTFTGRYTAVKSGFSSPQGPSNVFVDIVQDGNSNVYVQDPTGTNATVESYDVNISTSWISLGDILGYGKFYKWTLLGGKKNATLDLTFRTAYDYEPYWTDTQDYNADALTEFSAADQYGTMTNSDFVDQALKVEVDGSRHKTDAVRLCVSTNNGTARDDIEIVGAKLEIGVRPGNTLLGSGRTVS